jgi:diacylglycerol kinase (ATP)
VLALLRLDAGWWLFNLFCIALVLSAELFNTALEHLADKLHPERDPAIKVAKDCAAGAVLILALLAVIVGLTTLWVMVPPLLQTFSAGEAAAG